MRYFATLLNNLGCRIVHNHRSSVFPHQRQYTVSQCDPGFVYNRTKELPLDSIESGFADKINTKFRREESNVNVLNRQPLKRLEQAIDRFLTRVQPILGCDFHWVQWPSLHSIDTISIDPCRAFSLLMTSCYDTEHPRGQKRKQMSVFCSI